MECHELIVGRVDLRTGRIFIIIGICFLIALISFMDVGKDSFKNNDEFGVHSFASRVAKSCTKFFESVLTIEKGDGTAPSSAEVGKKLYAVHATDYFPQGGVVEARSLGVAANEEPSFRPTIHFSLGELIGRHHEHITWDNKKFAVVTSLDSLRTQVINVNPFDTFILGNFRIPEDAVLIVPRGENVSLPAGVRVKFYDNESSSLREAIDQVVSEQDGWKIEMKSDGVGDGVAEIGGHPINTQEFFSNFLKDNPWVSMGSHVRSNRGYAGRIGSIDRAIQTLTGEPVYSVESQRYFLDYIELNLASVKKFYGEHELNTEAKTAILRAEKRLRQWVDEVRANIERQIEVGYQLNAQFLAETLSELSPVEVDQLIFKNRELFEKAGIDKAKLDYALRRTILRGNKLAEEENLLDIVDVGFSETGVAYKSLETLKNLVSHIEDNLTEGSDSHFNTLQVLSRPNVRAALARHLNIKLPDGLLSLDSYIRSHPITRTLYQELEALDSVSPDFQASMDIAARGAKYAHGEKWLASRYTSFSTARSAANNIGVYQLVANKMLPGFKLPLNSVEKHSEVRWDDSMTMVERIRSSKRGSGYSATDIFENLGLGQEFNSRFSSEEKFWESDISMIDAYYLLKDNSSR